MRTCQILLLCILGVALLHFVACSNEIGPNNCCFKFYPRRLNKSFIRSYQITDYRCPKTGVILLTKKSRHICANPSLSWVEGLMKHLDEASF